MLEFLRRNGQRPAVNAGTNGTATLQNAPLTEPINHGTPFSQRIHDIFARFSRHRGATQSEHELLSRYRDAFQNEERLRQQIRETIPTKRLSQALFDSWADGYDQHMGEKHDPAVAHLVRQALELHNRNFGTYPATGKVKTGVPRIFGNGILEMSCGTGTVVKLLCENLSPEDLAGATFIANDTSREMKAKARQKFAQLAQGHRPAKIVFGSSDLRRLDVAHPFNTAILSQTLHLISDPALLDKERHPQQTLFEIDDEHLAVKLDVIRGVFRRMDYGDHFILIDEWPAVLTKRAQQRPDEALISALFYEIFRPIKDRAAFSDLMKNIPEACFVAELKSRIDQYHSMYMLIYRKDPIRPKLGGPSIPTMEEIRASPRLLRRLPRIETARTAAMDKVFDAFVAIDRQFIDTFKPVNGEAAKWAPFIPLEKATPFECTPEKLAGKDSLSGATYDTIVLKQVLHEMDDTARQALIKKAIDSLNLGGAIMFIEEWPPKNAKQPLSSREFRNATMRLYERELVFEGALRQTIMPEYDSGMYGYLYRKMG